MVVKHSVRASRWWFTLIGDEDVISKIESSWANIRPDLSWTLLRSLRSRPHINSISMDVQPAVGEVKDRQAAGHSITAGPSSPYPAGFRQSLCPQPPSPGISVDPQVPPQGSASNLSPWHSAAASQSLPQSSSNAQPPFQRALSTLPPETFCLLIPVPFPYYW